MIGSWCKVSDGFYRHPKFLGLPRSAIGLWVMCLAYASDNLTDGHMPAKVFDLFQAITGDDMDADRRALVEAGLLDEDDDGWMLHDYLDYQQSRKQVESLHEKRSKAGRKGGRTAGKNRPASREKSSSKQSYPQADRPRPKHVPEAFDRPRPEAFDRPTPEADTDTDTDTDTTPLVGARGVQGGRAPSNPPTASAGSAASARPNDETAGNNKSKKTHARTGRKHPEKILGYRLPDGWTPTRSEANLRTERETGGGDDWLTGQLARFRDYWTAAPGAKGRKADWDATWRNWIRRSAEQKPPQNEQLSDMIDIAMADALGGSIR